MFLEPRPIMQLIYLKGAILVEVLPEGPLKESLGPIRALPLECWGKSFIEVQQVYPDAVLLSDHHFSANQFYKGPSK